MEQRRIVDEQILVSIPVERVDTYEVPIFWKDILATKGLLPTDVFCDLAYQNVKESGFASMKMPEDLETYRVPKILVIRKRPENDEEYLKRMQEEARRKEETEEREKLEYLRLKAKFEKNGTQK